MEESAKFQQMLDHEWIWKSEIPEDIEKRILKIANKFRDEFAGEDPNWFLRVPGRVNLIGEHIDYCGYPVFPMAIQQDILICFKATATAKESGVTTGMLSLINTNDEYEKFSTSLNEIRRILGNREIGKKPAWHLYFLCGIQGIIDHFSMFKDFEVNIKAVVDGRIPANAGLSSSSALVCSAALTALIGTKLEMNRYEMASLCAKSEKWIGTEGGGMDQAIAMLAVPGTAQIIEFYPELKGELVKMPLDALFVVANSLVQANKAATENFNKRVAECKLSTWMLGKSIGLDDWLSIDRLKLLEDKVSYSTIRKFHKKIFHKDPYHLSEIAEFLGMKVSKILENPLLKKISDVDHVEFHLHDRILHVLEESTRVRAFQDAAMVEDLNMMGNLMMESHSSLSKLYDCSHPLLDKLVQVSNKHSYGARLTGAGWGGCIIALTDKSKLDEYLKALQLEFYGPIYGLEQLDPAHVFVTQPGAGAMVYEYKTRN